MRVSSLKDTVGVGRRNCAQTNQKAKTSRTKRTSMKRLARTICVVIVLSLDIQRLIAQSQKLEVVPVVPRRIQSLLGKSI